MDADVSATLRAGEVTFDADDAALLRAIDASGSVSAAARTLGRSRPRALGRLERLEGELGSLVERRRGGADGGGSRLTPTARTLLARFDRLRAALSGMASVEETVLDGTVTSTDGELGLVETPAGTVRALVVDTAGTPTAVAPGDAVQVSLRADAFTLHAPADAPRGEATSARNRFRGRVVGVERGEAVAHVALDVGLDDPLLALVTVESVRRLDLDIDDDVVASFKATATRATPRSWRVS